MVATVILGGAPWLKHRQHIWFLQNPCCLPELRSYTQHRNVKHHISQNGFPRQGQLRSLKAKFVIPVLGWGWGEKTIYIYICIYIYIERDVFVCCVFFFVCSRGIWGGPNFALRRLGLIHWTLPYVMWSPWWGVARSD